MSLTTSAVESRINLFKYQKLVALAHIRKSSQMKVTLLNVEYPNMNLSLKILIKENRHHIFLFTQQMKGK